LIWYLLAAWIVVAVAYAFRLRRRYKEALAKELAVRHALAQTPGLIAEPGAPDLAEPDADGPVPTPPSP
jgi:hypothetical protein